MPNTKTAKKENRKTQVRRLRNKSAISKMRTLSKKFLTSTSNVLEHFKDTQSYMASLVSKGIIHKNTLARKISRLHKVLKQKVQE